MLAFMLMSAISFANDSNNWKLKAENLTTNEKIEATFSNEKEFYSFLEDNSNLFTFNDEDTCSASVEITVGVATTTFSMEGPCEGFSARFASRVGEAKKALQATLEESSWWDDFTNWW